MRRRAQPGLGQHRAERAPVLGQVDRLRRGADDRHAGVLEPLRQPQRGLPAELHDHADHAGAAGRPAGGVLGVPDLQHVLEGQRLEVEPVGGVVVGGDRLRVAVDHHGLEVDLAQRHHRVHAGVVELDALADPVRPGAQDHHLRPVRRRDLGLLVVGGVVVRRGRRELGRAGVDGLVDRAQPEPVAQRPHAVLAGQLGAQRGELPVGQPGPLGPAQQLLVEHRRRARISARSSIRATIWSRNHGSIPPEAADDLLDGGAQAQRPLDRVEPAVVRHPQRREGVLHGGAVGVRLGPEAGRRGLHRAHRLVQRLGEVAAQLIASPTDFIVVVSSGSAPGNFSNANRGIFTTT